MLSLPFHSFRFSDYPSVFSSRITRRVCWAMGSCLLLAVTGCDLDSDCDGDKVSHSIAWSKKAGYFLQELRPVHALQLPMAGGHSAELHEVWLEKSWRYSCTKRRYVSRGIQLVAVLNDGQTLGESHFLSVRGEDGLGRFNNQLYTPFEDTTLKTHYRLYLKTLHKPEGLQIVDSVELVSVP